ncbi:MULTISPECIES: N-acetyltransferase family protein [unclassified Caballeronia]|uniref:GNAT family N-acetyltransferase n=1 Tax=unclassified Caballeronia TaxID=2646786 RepID=UPI00285B0E5C|nr:MULTISPECIES: N-acetyltransferase family protein [unclassified Caballeronia]MDR5738398.1 GNAT family N-acetyltransferase [Caballeronia sp. LZ016]MDR5811746.1 GNAT family N-acetyltransferase [Caballeronia sp. LZ019]
MSLTYRDATLDDLPAIVAIYNSTIASRQVTADLDPVSIESRLAWFHSHGPHARPLWVVEEGGEVIAWLSFSDFYGRPAYARTVEVSIYLHERARGKGLGKKLLQEALDRAPSLGVDTVLGFVFGHNEASMRLFASFGFTAWGRLPRVAMLDGVERDLVILGLRLDGSEKPAIAAAA